MVARITTPGSLQKTLNYNEHKVKQGKATCIGENGFLLPLHKMNFYDKLETFEYRNKLNERATTKTLHVSLNFSPSERYNDDAMLNIAHDYMYRIGFNNQPYLVYHHYDAGHPHIHILSSTIRADGTRINTHNIGRNQSELARKFVEEKYDLVKAGNSLSQTRNQVVPFNLERLNYGKIETKRGIANVLKGVLANYNYTSLPELNAVLKQFNVFADRCDAGSFVHTKRGLYFRVLGANGLSMGVPIKASSIEGNPTLTNLEKRFEKNKQLRDPLRTFLRTKIDHALLENPSSISELSTLLLKSNVIVVSRQNEDGKMYGITFVDNEKKCVFNGSEIGRQYSVAGLLKQMNYNNSTAPHSTEKSDLSQQVTGNRFIEFNGLLPLSELIAPENEFNPTPYQLKRKKKKRKY